MKEQVGAEVVQTPAPAITSASSTSTKVTTAPVLKPAALPVLGSEEPTPAASKSRTDTPPITRSGSTISFAAEKTKSEAQAGSGGVQASRSLAMRQLGHEAAARAKQNKSDALAARKVQVAGADEASKSGGSGTAPGAGTKDGTPATAFDQVVADGQSNTTTSPAADNPKSATSKATVATSTDSKEATDSGSTTTNPSSYIATGATATRPESPLPAPFEQATTDTEDTTTKSESATSQSSLPLSAHIIPSGSEITTHRGSSIITASKEEIKKIEEALKIPEEPEEEDEEDEHRKPEELKSMSNPVAESSAQSTHRHIRFAGAGKSEGSNRVAAATPRSHPVSAEASKAAEQILSNKGQDEARDVSTSQPKPTTQQQAAADPTKAIESVED